MAFVKVLDKYWYLNVADKVMYSIQNTFDKKANVVANVSPDTLASFPSIFYTQLNPLERGQDLTNETINAIDCTIEVRGYVNTGKDKDCKALLEPVIEGFKKFRFNVTTFPIYTKQDNVVRGVVRFNRIVGADDKDLTYKVQKVKDN